MAFTTESSYIQNLRGLMETIRTHHDPMVWDEMPEMEAHMDPTLDFEEPASLEME